MAGKFDEELKEFESLVTKIPEDVLDEFRQRVWGHSYFVPLDGHHALMHIVDVSCKNAYVFLLSGNDTTNTNGEVVLSLNKILCDYRVKLPPPHSTESLGTFLVSRPQCTALPETDKPVLLTTSVSMTNVPTVGIGLMGRDGRLFSTSALDVKVTVKSWKANGTKAANIPFSWMCTVEAAGGFLLGQ